MKRGELGLVALVLGAAALLRLLWLDSVPGGWHHDEGLMGVLAGEVLRGENRPLFFSAYLGQEPLYIYLGALAMAFLGEGQSILALRLTSALLGIATVGATYLLGREWFGRRAALVGAALLAVSFWHLVFSRDGYRVIAQPLLETLSLYLLWVGARSKISESPAATRLGERRSWFLYVLAGLLFGGVVYTYLAGRAFPFVLLPFGLWWLFRRGLPRREEGKRAALFVGVALLAMAPVALFFVANPDLFWARTTQLSPLGLLLSADGREKLGSNILRTLGMFTVSGDPLWRSNIPGRPVFPWFWAPFFYLGLAAAVRRAWQGQAAAAMLLSWLLVMVAPAALSYEGDIAPNGFRTLGLLGALYLVPALGLADLGSWLRPEASTVSGSTELAEVSAEPLSRRLGRHLTGGGWRGIGLAVTSLLLLAEGALNVNAYFGLWARHLGTAIEMGEDVVAAARYLKGEATRGEVTGFFSSDMYPHPVVKQLAPEVYPHLRWFDGRQSLVLPAAAEAVRLSAHDEAQTYLFPYLARNDDLLAFLPAQARVAEEFFTEGPAKFIAFRLSPQELTALRDGLFVDPSFARLSANLGGEVELLGYRLGQRVEAGGRLPLTLIWRVLRQPRAGQPPDYVFFSHLIDETGQSWGVGDVNGFPVPEWRPGDLVIGRYDLAVKKGAPSGAYQVWVGVYDRRTMERLPLLGDAPASGLSLGRVRVVGAPVEKAAIPQRREVTFDDGVALAGFGLEQTSDQLGVALYWRAARPLEQDYTVFVQLLDETGRLVAQDDSPPARGRLPTSFWEAGELVADAHRLSLAGLTPGRYQLIVGLYLFESGQRLRTAEGSDYLSLSLVDLNP